MFSRTFRACSLAAVMAVVVSAGPALAQQPPPAPAAGPTGQTAPSGPTLALSMDQAVSMALETSLGLKNERMNLDLASQDIVSAQATFLPQVSSSVSRTSDRYQPGDFTQGATDISNQSINVAGTVSQELHWGGSRYTATWSGNRGTQQNGFPTYNPALGSTVQFSLVQPLWQGLHIDNNRAGLQRADEGRTIADVQLQQRVVSTAANVREAYLAFVAAIEGRKVAQENMDLAETSLRNLQARVAVGQAPQIDIITAEAQVATNREQLILGDANIARTEDALRSLTLDPNRPDYWQVHLTPTDTIQLTKREVDVDAAIQNALANRLDLQVLKRQMEITDLNRLVNQDAIHPQVDLNFNLSASGSGGTRITYGDGFPPAILSTTSKGFGSVLGDAFTSLYPRWTLGVNVGYPIGHTAAKAALASTQIQQQQQHNTQRQLELDIVGQVRQAARDVQTSYERVQATQAGREASELQLRAEERRFAVGLTDLFTLQSRQSQLAAARVSELNAVIAYNNALIEFDRVQKIQ